MGTVFEKIIDGQLPSEKVYEDEKILAIKDIHPAAPVHLLIMPKKKGIKNLQDLQEKDLPLLMDIVRVAQKLAQKFGVADNYRLISNVGPKSGQTIFHLHFHLVGGRDLGALA